MDGDSQTKPGDLGLNLRGITRSLVVAPALGAGVGAVVGLGSALFLVSLEAATQFRTDNLSIVFLLPLAGLLLGWFYERFGAPIAGGTDIIIDRIEPMAGAEGRPIPLRMAPMVLVGTVLTHLFGGSAGREGTAVQMGSSLADGIGKGLRIKGELRRSMVVAGVAGGFGSVFGTPIAGVIFALEFTTVGRIRHVAVLPALLGAVVGDLVTHGTGVDHAAYPTIEAVPLDGWMLLKWFIFALAMALATAAFIELTSLLKRLSVRWLRRLPWRMAVGGLGVVLLWQLVGTDDYLGLGVPMILAAFSDPDFPVYAFALKLLFTAVTLSAGYLGGEVTPLFFVGAALGAVLAPALGIPAALGAAVGLATVFGAASNAPIALTVMAVEVLGGGALPHVAIVVLLTFVLTGHRSIYGGQRLGRLKSGELLRRTVSLSGLHASRGSAEASGQRREP